MSHHIDSAAAREDGRLDLCDLYVFDSADPQTTVLIMTVNPDAGRSSPTAFHPQAVYAFHVDTDHDAVEDLSFRASFGTPAADGVQTVAIRRAERSKAQAEAAGELLADGRVGDILSLAGGGRAWTGLAGDPFFGNGIGLGAFMQAIMDEQRYDPTAFAQGGNLFARRNVTGIVLEVPTATLGVDTIRVWQTTSLHDHGARAQINRQANPMMPSVFIVDEQLRDAYNSGHPRNDVALLHEPMSAWIGRIVALAGTAGDAEAYGRGVADMLLPDMLTYRLGSPANYGFTGRNGRRLGDDAMSVLLSLAANQPLAAQAPPSGDIRGKFPYLPAPYPAAEPLPPLNPRTTPGA
jgi:hypothetical protein